MSWASWVVGMSALHLTVSPAAATPPLWRQSLPRPPAPALEATLTAGGGGWQLTLLAGGEPRRVSLPGGVLKHAELVWLSGSEGPFVVVALNRADGAQWKVLFSVAQSELQWLHTARSDWQGDPGEQVAEDFEQLDVDGDGEAELLRGFRQQGQALCSSDGLVLPLRKTHVWQPKRRSWRPIVVPWRARLPAAAYSIRASIDGLEGGATPLPSLFALQTVATGDEGALLTGAWRGGRRHPIEAISLQTMPRRSFWLLGDNGVPLRVEVPPGLRLPAHGRWWIVPPQPLAWRCLSLLVEATSANRPFELEAMAAELSVHSDLDRPEALAALLLDLQASGEKADDAERLLMLAGALAMPPLLQAWPKLEPAAQRRAVRIAAPQASGEGRARSLLLAATQSTDPVAAQQALAALQRAGNAAAVELGRRATSADRLGDQAALAVASTSPRALEDLLAALAATGGSERPLVRLALHKAVARRDDDGDAPRFRRWAESAALPARAAAVLALASFSERSAGWAACLQDTWRTAMKSTSAFAERWRLTQAAVDLPDDAAIDALLLDLVAADRPWMLQAAALDVLARRRSPLADSAARRALHATAPRLRVRAIRLLADDAKRRSALRRLARLDPWPMVRQAAADAL